MSIDFPHELPRKPTKGMLMRCAQGCGQVVRSQGDLNTLRRECVQRGGFVQIGDLFYCPRCPPKVHLQANTKRGTSAALCGKVSAAADSRTRKRP